uniref:Uncharacterized protein n=1 Tax=Anguilla anguilla TaxID=7936 RepID=A0A0E9UKJ9_ANGAN
MCIILGVALLSEAASYQAKISLLAMLFLSGEYALHSDIKCILFYILHIL